jgi:catalase
MEIDTLGMNISTEEKQAIVKAMEFGRKISRAAEKVNGLPYRRDAHAKGSGCVRASFTVNSDIPNQFRHSVFKQPGAEFQAWIRFSNGDMTVRADGKPDARGMAVKVINVPGEKIAPELPESGVQDFIMTNLPIFFHRNVFDYVDNMQYLAKLQRTSWFINLWPPRLRLRRLLIAKKTVSSKIKTPLQPQYYSMVPYQLGDTPIKFCAKPSADMTFTEAVDTSDFDFLTEAMQAKLKNSSASFDFMVQEQKPGKNMPIDDATVKWSERDSPFIPIAKITIPPQELTSEAQMTFCENLSMNPWHGVGAWQPLGSLNRSRRLVYHAVSMFRHEQNNAPVSDPYS